MYGLGNAEIKIMKELWERGDLTAKELACEMGKKCRWNANTTYTLMLKWKNGVKFIRRILMYLHNFYKNNVSRY